MKRVLVLGIDGGTFSVIRPLIEAGRLPNMARLYNSGSRADLVSTFPPLTPPAWATLMMGTNCGNHGVFYFFPWDLDNYSIAIKPGEGNFVTSSQIKGTPFWRVMNKHGKKTILVNLPLTYPPFPVDGCVVSGFPAPDDPEVFTHPPELSKELDNYQIDMHKIIEGGNWNLANYLRKEGPDVFLKQIFDLQEKRTSACIELMGSKEWDFFMVVFVCNDRLSHLFWPESLDDAQNPLFRYLEVLDRDFGRLLDAADAGPEGDGQTSVVVMSDHGFGPTPSQGINVFDVLKKSGHLKLKPLATPYVLAKYLLRRAGLVKAPITPADLPRIIDLKRTQIFPVPIYASFCGIAVNTEGEKAHGCVKPGREYEKVVSEVTEFLMNLKDPRTDKNVVLSVVRREDVYKGDRLRSAPDLLITLDPAYIFGYGLNLLPAFRRRKAYQPGDHLREGILILNGPGIKTCDLASPPTIADVTPTLLYSLGVPIPHYMEGSLIEEAFERSFIEENPPSFVTWDEEEEQRSTEGDLQGEDASQIERQLRDLGYL